MVFDSLRFSRRLVAGGVPEESAQAHAEALAAEFGAQMDNLVTKDYLRDFLDARLAEQDARIDARFLEQDARINARFSAIEKHFDDQIAGMRVTLGKHSVAMAATFVAVVIPLVRDVLG